MNAYTFYWLTGERNVFAGDSPSDALNKAGFGQGALRALDFWAYGDCDDYQWDKEKRSWVKSPISGIPTEELRAIIDSPGHDGR